MRDLELELIRVGNQIDDVKKIQEVERLYSEMRSKCEGVEREKLTEKVRKLSVGNLVFVIYKLREFYDKWGESQVSPNERELESAERVIKEIFKIIDKVDEKDFPPFFGENHRLEAREGMVSLRLMIDEEKSRSKIHSSINN